MKHSGFVVNCEMKSERKRLIIVTLAFELGEPNRILLNVITHTYPTSFFFPLASPVPIAIFDLACIVSSKFSIPF